ncbi:MAG: hypothetical protein ABGX16_06180 [Pirellulales bacterium]
MTGAAYDKKSMTYLWIMIFPVLFLWPTGAAATGSSSTAEIVELQIGFGGLYKLGCWTPVSITLQGGEKEETGRVELVVTDTDGVLTTVPSPTIHLEPKQLNKVSMLMRPGQAQGLLQVRWSVAGQIHSQRTYSLDSTERNQSQEDLPANENTVPAGLPSTNRLLLVVGPPPGITQLIQTIQAENTLATTHVAHALNTERLPTLPSGYDSIDTMVLTTSDPTIYDPLLANPERLHALSQWIDQGGRLILFCGRSGPDLLPSGKPLAQLIPGHYQRQLPLRNLLPLETFSGDYQSLARGRLRLQVPKLTKVSGHILAFGGRSPTDLPLVIKSARQLGEIIFIGIDVDLPPFRDWSGRASLLRKLLDWQPQEFSSGQQLSPTQTTGYDLTTQLRGALDQHFTDVETISFALVAILAIGYIGLIGPGDYFFLKRALRRMEMTWLTFPLIVVGTSVGAYWLATTSKGNQLRVAQIEIVDVNLTHESRSLGNRVPGYNVPSYNVPKRGTTEETEAETAGGGLIRGTVWTHIFSPSAMRYQLTIDPCLPGQPSAPVEDIRSTTKSKSPKSIVSWLGLPGRSLGGMQSGGTQTGPLERGYTFGESLQSLQGLPIQVWSTKTINAQWFAEGTPAFEMELRQTSDQLLTGHISNHLGVELTDCLLLYGRWAYHLARLGDERTIKIDDNLQPRTLKTMLTNASAGDTAATRIAEDGTVFFDRLGTDVARIVKAMMFYQAIGGASYTGALNRYQHQIDMSQLLTTGRAILLARAPGSGSQWLHNHKRLGSNQDQHWLYYRFVATVQE